MENWRPPVFNTPEELQVKVNEYFEKWYRKKKINLNWEEIEVPDITTTDLALYLGFESRQSIYDYAKREKYSYIIKRALFFIEREYEEKLLFSQNTSWAIFALKNMWWKDQTMVDQTVKSTVELNVSNLNDWDIDKWIKDLL